MRHRLRCVIIAAMFLVIPWKAMATATTVTSNLVVYKAALHLLLAQQPDLTDDPQFIFNYGLLFDCTGQTFDQVTIHEHTAAWRVALHNLAGEHFGASLQIAVRLTMPLGTYDYDAQTFGRPSLDQGSVVYALSANSIRQGCTYTPSPNAPFDSVRGDLPLIAITLVNSDDIGQLYVPRARAESALRRMGGSPVATYAMVVRVVGLNYEPNNGALFTAWGGLASSDKGAIVMQAEITSYRVYAGRAPYGEPLASWVERPHANTSAVPSTGGHDTGRARNTEGATATAAALVVTPTGSWITPGTQTGDSGVLYVHERATLAAHGNVTVTPDQLVADVALPNGGTARIRAQLGPAPGYWQTDLYGQPIYSIPKKPSVALNEDLGALGRLSLSSGQSANYVVTFDVPVADSDGNGHVQISRITWTP